MSIIVVEGVDGSGKSTLMENARLAIKKRYFVLVRHSCRPLHIRDAIHFKNMAESFAGDIIVDRHPFISEPIYGPILRNENLVGEYSPREINDNLRSTVDRIIYCRPPFPEIEKNIERLPQLAGVKDKLTQLVEAYDDRMMELESAGIPVHWYNYTCDATDLETMFFGAKP